MIKVRFDHVPHMLFVIPNCFDEKFQDFLSPKQLFSNTSMSLRWRRRHINITIIPRRFVKRHSTIMPRTVCHIRFRVYSVILRVRCKSQPNAFERTIVTLFNTFFSSLSSEAVAAAEVWVYRVRIKITIMLYIIVTRYYRGKHLQGGVLCNAFSIKWRIVNTVCWLVGKLPRKVITVIAVVSRASQHDDKIDNVHTYANRCAVKRAFVTELKKKKKTNAC